MWWKRCWPYERGRAYTTSERLQPEKTVTNNALLLTTVKKLKLMFVASALCQSNSKFVLYHFSLVKNWPYLLSSRYIQMASSDLQIRLQVQDWGTWIISHMTRLLNFKPVMLILLKKRGFWYNIDGTHDNLNHVNYNWKAVLILIRVLALSDLKVSVFTSLIKRNCWCL